METLTSSATIVSSPSYLPIFSPKSKDPSSITRRILRFSISPKNNGNESELRSDSNDSSLVPILSNRTLSKDAAMGLVLSASNVRGWITGSGMEGPPVPAGSELESSTEKISTFPWSLFTKSPRRRMRVACAINPHAYTDGTVFVQCCGCNVFHKLVDNLLPERLSISNMLPSSLPVEALHNGKEECGRDFDICGVEGILRNMSAIEREVLGFMCKDIIDMGRFMWLKEHGLESQLVKEIGHEDRCSIYFRGGVACNIPAPD